MGNVLFNFRVPFCHFKQRFYAQSEELTEWKSALPGESEMYVFDAPGTPKFLQCMFFCYTRFAVVLNFCNKYVIRSGNSMTLCPHYERQNFPLCILV